MRSAAYKTLSPNACWLFDQLQLHFKGPGRYPLSFKDVSWKLGFKPFDKARAELFLAGFVVVLEQHGLDRKATVYGLSEKWRARSEEIMKDPAAGHVINRLRHVNGVAQTVSEWVPSKVPAAWRAANLAKANAALKDVRSPGRGRRSKRALVELHPELTERTAKEKPKTVHAGHAPGLTCYKGLQGSERKSPSIVCKVANVEAPVRLQGSERVVCKVANVHGTMKILSKAAVLRLRRRRLAGEDPASLRAEVEAAGFEVPAGLRVKERTS